MDIFCIIRTAYMLVYLQLLIDCSKGVVQVSYLELLPLALVG